MFCAQMLSLLKCHCGLLPVGIFGIQIQSDQLRIGFQSKFV